MKYYDTGAFEFFPVLLLIHNYSFSRVTFPGIEPRSPAFQADALTSELPGKPYFFELENI